MANSCKYYTERTLGWMLNNKLIVFLSLLTFSLFVSTWALAAQKNRALSRIDDLNAQLATTTTTTTLAPVTNPEAPGTDETTTSGSVPDGNGGTGDSEGNIEGSGNGRTGGTRTVPETRKSDAAVNVNEEIDREEMVDALPSGVVNSNDPFDNVDNESDILSIVQKSKLLTALAA